MADRTLPEGVEIVEIVEAGCECRTVPGYPGYAVAENGTAWSRWKRGPGGIGGKWRALKLNPQRGGYLQICLAGPTGHDRVNIHVVMLSCFVGPRPQGCFGCHNDGNPKNNHRSNLRWDTPKANTQDGIRHGTVGRGETHVRATTTDAIAREIRREYKRIRGSMQRVPKGTHDLLSSRFGISKVALQGIATRRTWRHLEDVDLG